MTAPPRLRRAFTLIELLTVIAIIGLLAAILFPVFGRARDNARRSSCQSNLRQMGLAMVQYTADYDEAYPYIIADNIGSEPPGGRWLGSTVTAWVWPQILYPYHKSLEVFVCPTRVGTWTIRGRYGANQRLIISSSDGPATKLSAVVAPSKTYAFMDAGYYTMVTTYAVPSSAKTEYGYYLPGIGALGSTCDLGSPNTYQSLKQDCDIGRHFGGVNVAFADGHVKWLTTGAVSAEAQRTDRGAWNYSNS